MTRSKLLPTNAKNGECLICGDLKGKCRTNGHGDYFQCMTNSDGLAEVLGFHFAGMTKDGLWGQYIAKTDLTDSERSSRSLKFRLQREQSEKDRIKQLQGTLLSADRDKNIRAIAKFLGLKENHKADLLARGLSVAQIEKNCYFSVQKGGNPIPDSVPLNFPSVQRDYKYSQGRKELYSPVTGYACVAFDHLDRAIGIQFRDENKDSDNKYKWLPKSQLRNGENAITVNAPVFEGNIPQNTALLTEGILKPHIASVKHGCISIGAAGGLFSNSPQQFKNIINQYNISSLFICSDAGDLINPHVRRRWSGQIKWIRNNYPNINISCLWWSQWHKEDAQDIDEIDDLSGVKLLTTDEFFRQSTYNAFAKKEWRKSKRFTPQTKVHKQYFDYIIPAENSIFAIKSPLGTGKTTWVINLIKTLINETFIYPQYRNSLNIGFVGKVSETLAENEGDDHNFKYVNDYKEVPRRHDGSIYNLALCIDSFLKLNDEDFNNCNLILDEIISIIKHLEFSATLKNKRIAIIDKFEQAIKRAKRVILLDGNLTDWAVNFISDIDKTKEIIKIENTFKPVKQKVYFLNGEFKEDGNIKLNSHTDFIKKILETSARTAICSDSQVFLESLENLILKEYPDTNILRVDSKTKAEEKLLEVYQNGKVVKCNLIDMFLYNPNQYLEKNNIDILLYSPSCESGVDISIENYFSSQFGFFFGVLDVDSIMQIIKRIRANCTRYIWVRKWSSNEKPLDFKSCFSETLKKQYKLDMVNEMLDLGKIEFPSAWLRNSVLSQMELLLNQSYNSHFDYGCLIQAFQNYEKANLRDCVRERLIATDYDVEDYYPCIDDDADDSLRQAKKEVKLQNCQDILEADYLPLEFDRANSSDLQWKKPEDERNQKKPDRVGMINLGIRKRLPGIETTRIWNIDFIKEIQYDNPSVLKRLELLYLYQNPDVPENLQKSQFHFLLTQEKFSLFQVRKDHRFIRALHTLKFDELLNCTYSGSSEAVIRIYRQLKADPKLQNDLRIKVGKIAEKQACQLIQRIAGTIGYKQQKLKATDENGTRYYELTSILDEPKYSTIFACIDRRFEKFKDENFVVDWSDLAFLDRNLEKDAEGICQDGFTQVHPTENLAILYTNGGGCAVSESVKNEIDKLELSDENINDLAESLSLVNDKSESSKNILQCLRETYDAVILKVAYLRLPVAIKRIVKDLTIQLNYEATLEF